MTHIALQKKISMQSHGNLNHRKIIFKDLRESFDTLIQSFSF